MYNSHARQRPYVFFSGWHARYRCEVFNAVVLAVGASMLNAEDDNSSSLNSAVRRGRWQHDLAVDSICDIPTCHLNTC